MKLKYFLIALCVANSIAQAQSFTEQQIYDYRVTMQQAGQDLQNQQAHAAFAKMFPLAQQGFAEAQYIIATMYHDGEGVTQNLTQAKHWYSLAAQQTDNQAVADLAQESLFELP